MNKAINPEWAATIRAEYEKLKGDEMHLHNNLIHNSILETWERESPVMWRRLRAARLTDPLAYVVQARMWAQQEELMRGGMPVTDAREQAEREHLMLEPEDDTPPRLPEVPQTPDL